MSSFTENHLAKLLTQDRQTFSARICMPCSTTTKASAHDYSHETWVKL